MAIFANMIKSSESFSKQPAQLIVKLKSSLQHIIVTIITNAALSDSNVGFTLSVTSYCQSQDSFNFIAPLTATNIRNGQICLCTASLNKLSSHYNVVRILELPFEQLWRQQNY